MVGLELPPSLLGIPYRGVDLGLVAKVESNRAIYLVESQRGECLTNALRRRPDTKLENYTIQRYSSSREIIAAIPLFDVVLSHTLYDYTPTRQPSQCGPNSDPSLSSEERRRRAPRLLPLQPFHAPGKPRAVRGGSRLPVQVGEGRKCELKCLRRIAQVVFIMDG